MCKDAKLASKKSRNMGKGSKGRRKVFRATYRNLSQWDIEQWEIF